MAFARVGTTFARPRRVEAVTITRFDVGGGVQGSRFGLGRTQHVTVYAIESGIRRRPPVRVRG